MSEISAYTVTPRQARAGVVDCLQANLVPFLHSSPGMGKSAIMRSVAEDAGLILIDHRLSTSPPEDLSGLPRFRDDGRAEFVPFADLFPLVNDKVPEGYNGWMLFLDEFNSARKETQAAAYKLILDKMTGQKKLNPMCFQTAAGNLTSDRAIVNPIGTAMQSRVIHLEMTVNFDEWIEDVAYAQNWDTRIIAFLSQFPSKLMDFDPNHKGKTFCCPRTWEFMQNFLAAGVEPTDDRAALFSGTITGEIALQFIQFTKVFQHIVKVSEIMTDPMTARLPQDTPTQWATVATMMEKLTAETIDKFSIYADRFDFPFRVMFYRNIMVRQPKLRDHPAFRKATVQLAKYLNPAYHGIK